MNIQDKSVNELIKKIEGNKSNFLKYLELGIPEVTAALFSIEKVMICESYQLVVF
jgi:hypothetical protein